jgi:hypothetical protein
VHVRAVSVRPVGGIDYPPTFRELLEWFPGLRGLFGLWWNACGGRTLRVPGLWMRGGRRRPLDVLRVWPADVGDRGDDLHRIRTPISTCCAAIWFITSRKNGVSAQGLQRVLGFNSYDTAWAWLHRFDGQWSDPNTSCSPVWLSLMKCSSATSLAVARVV